jgi:hypothetical protein
MADEKTRTNGWKLSDWNEMYGDHTLPQMSVEDIANAIMYLRNNNYPMPDDCPGDKCPKHRPSCKLGICNVAVGMCGDL